MKNPGTTVIGYLVLCGTLARFVMSLASGTVDATILHDVAGAFAGVGLILAKDGGH